MNSRPLERDLLLPHLRAQVTRRSEGVALALNRRARLAVELGKPSLERLCVGPRDHAARNLLVEEKECRMRG